MDDASVSSRRRWICAVFVIAIVAAVGSCSVVGVNYAILLARLGLADGQVREFEDSRVAVLKEESPLALAQLLEHTIVYYPSGSKQATGSRLDRMVEVGRADTINHIIARLRVVTGRDLGSDASGWLKEYLGQ
jgi:hypothetical protein